MARLSVNTQNKRKDNAPKSCFNSDCDDIMFLPVSSHLVLLATMFSLALPLIVRGNVDISEKAVQRQMENLCRGIPVVEQLGEVNISWRFFMADPKILV